MHFPRYSTLTLCVYILCIIFRFQSLNAVKPLPLPQSMKSLSSHQLSKETFHNTQCLAATSLPQRSVQPCALLYPRCQEIPWLTKDLHFLEQAAYEMNLNSKMIEDNEELIIPDDMRQFLQQQQADSLLPASSGSNGQAFNTHSVDEWVLQTNSINHSSLQNNR